MNRPDLEIILGIDVGTVYVGLALGYPERGIASPLLIVDKNEAEAKILAIIKERSIETVVCGLPLHENGNESPMSLKARKFSRRLLKRADIKIVFVDEYASSIDARENSVFSRKSSKERIDDKAAAEILRRFFAKEGIVS